MAEDEDKKEEEKFEFDSTGQAIAYISLDQARVLATRHAHENTDFYGQYAGRELAWQELSAEESEDYYRIQLNFRPARGFRGRPGVEQFTINKTGPVEFRQIIHQPRLASPAWPAPLGAQHCLRSRNCRRFGGHGSHNRRPIRFRGANPEIMSGLLAR